MKLPKRSLHQSRAADAIVGRLPSWMKVKDPTSEGYSALNAALGQNMELMQRSMSTKNRALSIWSVDTNSPYISYVVHYTDTLPVVTRLVADLRNLPENDEEPGGSFYSGPTHFVSDTGVPVEVVTDPNNFFYGIPTRMSLIGDYRTTIAPHVRDIAFVMGYENKHSNNWIVLDDPNHPNGEYAIYNEEGSLVQRLSNRIQEQSFAKTGADEILTPVAVEWYTAEGQVVPHAQKLSLAHSHVIPSSVRLYDLDSVYTETSETHAVTTAYNQPFQIVHNLGTVAYDIAVSITGGAALPYTIVAKEENACVLVCDEPDTTGSLTLTVTLSYMTTLDGMQEVEDTAFSVQADAILLHRGTDGTPLTSWNHRYVVEYQYYAYDEPRLIENQTFHHHLPTWVSFPYVYTDSTVPFVHKVTLDTYTQPESGILRFMHTLGEEEARVYPGVCGVHTFQYYNKDTTTWTPSAGTAYTDQITLATDARTTYSIANSSVRVHDANGNDVTRYFYCSASARINPDNNSQTLIGVRIVQRNETYVGENLTVTSWYKCVVTQNIQVGGSLGHPTVTVDVPLSEDTYLLNKEQATAMEASLTFSYIPRDITLAPEVLPHLSEDTARFQLVHEEALCPVQDVQFTALDGWTLEAGTGTITGSADETLTMTHGTGTDGQRIWQKIPVIPGKTYRYAATRGTGTYTGDSVYFDIDDTEPSGGSHSEGTFVSDQLASNGTTVTGTFTPTTSFVYVALYQNGGEGETVLFTDLEIEAITPGMIDILSDQREVVTSLAIESFFADDAIVYPVVSLLYYNDWLWLLHNNGTLSAIDIFTQEVVTNFDRVALPIDASGLTYLKLTLDRQENINVFYKDTDTVHRIVFKLHRDYALLDRNNWAIRLHEEYGRIKYLPSGSWKNVQPSMIWNTFDEYSLLSGTQRRLYEDNYALYDRAYHAHRFQGSPSQQGLVNALYAAIGETPYNVTTSYVFPLTHTPLRYNLSTGSAVTNVLTYTGETTPAPAPTYEVLTDAAGNYLPVLVFDQPLPTTMVDGDTFQFKYYIDVDGETTAFTEELTCTVATIPASGGIYVDDFGDTEFLDLFMDESDNPNITLSTLVELLYQIHDVRWDHFRWDHYFWEDSTLLGKAKIPSTFDACTLSASDILAGTPLGSRSLQPAELQVNDDRSWYLKTAPGLFFTQEGMSYQYIQPKLIDLTGEDSDPFVWESDEVLPASHAPIIVMTREAFLSSLGNENDTPSATIVPGSDFSVNAPEVLLRESGLVGVLPDTTDPTQNTGIFTRIYSGDPGAYEFKTYVEDGEYKLKIGAPYPTVPVIVQYESAGFDELVQIPLDINPLATVRTANRYLVRRQLTSSADTKVVRLHRMEAVDRGSYNRPIPFTVEVLTDTGVTLPHESITVAVYHEDGSTPLESSSYDLVTWPDPSSSLTSLTSGPDGTAQFALVLDGAIADNDMFILVKVTVGTVSDSADVRIAYAYDSGDAATAVVPTTNPLYTT